MPLGNKRAVRAELLGGSHQRACFERYLDVKQPVSAAHAFDVIVAIRHGAPADGSCANTGHKLQKSFWRVVASAPAEMTKFGCYSMAMPPEWRSVLRIERRAMENSITSALPSSHWYVVHCQPLKEQRAAAAIRDQLGLTTYLPEIVSRLRGRVLRAPLFPRYFFVQADLSALGARSINTTPGVVRLVSFDNIPQSVPMHLIRDIYERVEQINRLGGLIDHGFRPGDQVRIKSGALRGAEAIFEGPITPSERVRVLLEILGSLRSVDVGIEMIERATPAARQERRTRGHGRRIASR